MSSLSTHVLDTREGKPAAGMQVRLSGADGLVLWEGVTDADGRCPPLRDLALEAGHYQLVFGVSAYFRACGLALPEPPFLDHVTLAFGVQTQGHYHVPLLCSPWSYSTYRGS